jgi:hypothetical protein
VTPADTPTYFTATTGLMGGRRFRVYDVRILAGRTRRATIGSLAATHRVFVPADKGRWTYEFSVIDSRALEPAALERQLQAATYRMPNPVARRRAMSVASRP